MVVLPGGYDGIEGMKENKQFLSLLQSMNKDHKYICSMCAAPAALEKANLLINKKFMAYQGYENKINLLTLSFLCMCLFTILRTIHHRYFSTSIEYCFKCPTFYKNRSNFYVTYYDL